MADNLDTITTLSSIPSGTKIATRAVSYSGDANAHVAPVGLVLIAGSDDAKTATDVSSAAPLPVTLISNPNGGSVDVSNDAIVTLNGKTLADGTSSLTPKFKAIAAASNGNNTLVAAVGGKKLRVLAYNFMAAGTVNAKFQTAAGGTDLTGLKYLVANTGIVAPFNPLGWFETVAGDLLNLNLSAAIAVGGELVYVEV